MAWWESFSEFLYTSIFKRPGEKEDAYGLENNVALRHSAIDVLYFLLGFFTNIYGLTITVIFFARATHMIPVLVQTLDAFQEPYLGALGVYVVLKEIRKRRHGLASRHFGEAFVVFWLLLLFVATVTVLFSASYRFDEVYKLIITNSLAALVIYIGGLINRP